MTTSKKTLSATLPDGVVVTRTTNNDYLYVVAVAYSVDQMRAQWANTARVVNVWLSTETDPKRIAEYNERLVDVQAALDGFADRDGAENASWGYSGWASRLDLAEKAANKGRGTFAFTQVVPVNA